MKRFGPDGAQRREPKDWAGLFLDSNVKPKALFVHIQHTAGVSMHHWFEKINKIQFHNSQSNHILDKNLIQLIWKGHRPLNLKESILFKSYFKFVFVRNPWSRIASNYHKKHKFSHDKKQFKLFLQSLIAANESSKEIKTASNLIIRQKPFIYDKGNNTVDFIGKFENFNEDFKYVCEQLSIKFENIPRKNFYGEYDYISYYNDETISMVYDYCKEDIEYFNYEFEK